MEDWKCCSKPVSMHSRWTVWTIKSSSVGRGCIDVLFDLVFVIEDRHVLLLSEFLDSLISPIYSNKVFENLVSWV